MSGIEKTVGPVRQLSLQQPPPRRQVRRQRSAEDDKSLRIYANSIVRDRIGTNSRNGSERSELRNAWGEHRQMNTVEQVEIVARQIPERSKPTAGRASRTFAGTDKPTILYSRQELAERLRLAWKHRKENKANIDIFLAHSTHQERCESELSSHAAVTAPPTPVPTKDYEDDNDQLTNDLELEKEEEIRGTVATDPLEQEVNEDANEKFGDDLRKEGKDCRLQNEIDIEETTNVKDTSKCLENKKKEGDEEQKIDTEKLTDSDTEDFIGDKKTCISVNCTNLNSRMIEIPMSKLQESDVAETAMKTTKADSFTAKQKRASFHNGTNRAFSGPATDKTLFIRSASQTDGKYGVISEKTKIENKSNATVDKAPLVRACSETRYNSTLEKNSSANPIETKLSYTSYRTTTVKTSDNPKVNYKKRTNSAPPQRRSRVGSPVSRLHVNIMIDMPNVLEISGKNVMDSTQQKATTKEIHSGKNETQSSKVTLNRPIRSAPSKRRFKSAKKRLPTGGSFCKEDDEYGVSRNRNGTRGKCFADSKTDVVTMVSLVSSADSESDEENSPGDNKLIDELRSKLPTTPIIKTSVNSVVSAVKKSIKSVSFQKDSFDESVPKDIQTAAKDAKGLIRLTLLSNEESMAWKTDVPSPILPGVTLIPNNEETLEIPLTDREKKCLAVPLGDLQDKKRRLLKTRTSPSRLVSIERHAATIEVKQQKLQSTTMQTAPQFCSMQQITSKTESLPSKVNSSVSKFPDETVQDIPQATMSEPQFQTVKEKECWHLYKRMCDKGIRVSFDTVLKGMLTPPEYRLRQKEPLQNS